MSNDLLDFKFLAQSRSSSSKAKKGATFLRQRSCWYFPSTKRGRSNPKIIVRICHEITGSRPYNCGTAMLQSKAFWPVHSAVNIMTHGYLEYLNRVDIQQIYNSRSSCCWLSMSQSMAGPSNCLRTAHQPNPRAMTIQPRTTLTLLKRLSVICVLVLGCLD